MKKYLILILAAAAALASCGKELMEPDNGVVEGTPITFELSADYSGVTKAVKSGWEAGDAIFVFFDKVKVPRHLKMTYNGKKWTSVEYDGETVTPGALELRNGDTGNMRAVYLPYGSNATVSPTGEQDEFGRWQYFAFSERHYAYYMTATLPYTVEDNKISGAFDMEIPEGYVQFFVEDDEASEYVECLLGIDAVISVDVASVAADGTIIETSDMKASDDLPGFFFDNGTEKGYIFYGKLDDSYNGIYHLSYLDYQKGYYFSKTKRYSPRLSDRCDYFVRGKVLASHDAIKLPAASNISHFNPDGSYVSGWQPVGKDITVKLQKISNGGATVKDLGTWFTCNYNQSVPESLGTLYTFDDAWSLFPSGATLPSEEQFETLHRGATWVWVKLHGNHGCVGQSDTGFLYFPLNGGGEGYWSSTPSPEIGHGRALLFDRDFDSLCVYDEYRTVHFAVRHIAE
jgi:hypothetical protein